MKVLCKIFNREFKIKNIFIIFFSLTYNIKGLSYFLLRLKTTTELVPLFLLDN